MKKKISVLLAAAMVLGLAGCAGSGQKAVQTPAATEAGGDKKRGEREGGGEAGREKGDDRVEVGRRRSGGHGGVRSQ